jgi:hypothetical protein
MIWNRKKKREEEDVRPPYRDPFLAIPHICEGVEVHTGSKSGYKLKKALKPEPGVADLLARWFKFKRDVRVDLDQHGTAFWKLVDGKRSLGEIEAILRKDMGMEELESKRAVILFTKGLMLRHLLALQMMDDSKRAANRIEY